MSNTHIRDFQNYLREEVERDLLREVLEKLKKHITDNDLIKDLALLLGRLTYVEGRYHTDGDMLSDEYGVQRSRIRKGVLQIIESLSDENCTYPDPSTHESSEGYPIGTITPDVTEDFDVYCKTSFVFYRQFLHKHESVFTDSVKLRSKFDTEKTIFVYDFFKLFIEDGALSKYYKGIEDSKLLLVLGHPGYGKTFYCKKLAYELSVNNRSSLSHDNLIIPYYFPASGLTEDQVDDFCRNPLKFIIDSTGNRAVPNLIIIDGITESILSHVEIINTINKISKIKKDDNIKTKCIITSRSFYFLPDDLKTNLTIFLKPATIEESGLPKFIKTAGVYDSIPVGLRAIPGFLKWVAQRGEYEDDQLTYDLFLNYVNSNLNKVSERLGHSFNQTLINELFSFVLAEVHKQEKVDLQYIVSELRASSINFSYKNEDATDLFKKLSEILSTFYIRLDDYNSNSHKLVLDIDEDVQNVFLANYLYNEKLAQFSNRDISSDKSLKIFWECFIDFKMDNSIFQLLVEIAKREKRFPRSSDDIKRFIKQTTVEELLLENGVGANSKLFIWDYISGFYYWWHFLKAVNTNDNLLPQNVKNVQLLLNIVMTDVVVNKRYNWDLSFQNIELREDDVENTDRRMSLSGAVLKGVNLSNSKLNRINFEECTLRDKEMILDKADLSEAYLSRTILIKVKCRGTIYRYSIIKGSTLIHIEADGAVFDNADLAESIISGGSFTGASFRNTNLSNCEINHGGDFSRADFMPGIGEPTNINGIKFTAVKLEQAKFNSIEALDTCFLSASMMGAEFKSTRFINADFSDTDLTGSYFTFADVKESRFHKTTFSKSNLEGAIFEQCYFESSNLSDCYLQGVRFIDCRLKGVQMQRIQVDLNTSFEGSDLSFANLKGMKYSMEDDDDELYGKIYQLLENCSCLYNAEGIPPEVVQEIKRKKPFLLWEPMAEKLTIEDAAGYTVKLNGLICVSGRPNHVTIYFNNEETYDAILEDYPTELSVGTAIVVSVKVERDENDNPFISKASYRNHILINN